MRAVIQRVQRASVQVDGENVGEIGKGLLVFVCAQPEDTPIVIERLLHKILKLRIFEDGVGKMNLSVQDVQGGLLLVSQFTLVADVSRGNRPSFTGAAAPEIAKAHYDLLVKLARKAHPIVETGVFGEHMQIELVNDGPVTIPMDIIQTP